MLKPHTRDRLRRTPVVFLALVTMVSATASWAQTPVTAGFRDFSYGSAVNPTPTGEKPESKLWWNDGIWWGSLFNASANQYRIYRFSPSTQSWTDTGTALDPRTSSKADVLWDRSAGKLYVASHVFANSGSTSSSSSNWGRLYRYSYSSSQNRYTLDSGFPVNVTRGRSETLTIAKDSTDRLWVTFVSGNRVKINWSISSDTDWGLPVDLPVGTTDISVSSDDISSVVAFPNGNIGVMWSNQVTDRTLFSVHRYTDAPTDWQPVEQVLPNTGCSGACADDHMNLKVDQQGRVYAAVKTSLGSSTQPLVMVVVRSTGGSWSTHTFGLVRDHHTRPILALDEDARRLYVFATSPESNGSIYMKSSSLDSISFPSGVGTAFIKSSSDLAINNATSTKQNVSSTTGLLVLAGDGATRFYLHNYLSLGGTPGGGGGGTVPAAPTNLTASAAASDRINLAWTDASNDESAFHIERATGSGTFAEIATVGANVTTYSDTSVAASTTYSYRVRARNTVGFSGYSNTDSATTPAGGGTSQRIKNITFEAGTLTDPTSGVDTVTGTVVLETAAPLKGSFSASIPNTASSYLEERFTATDDFFVSMYVRVNAASLTRLVLISNAGTAVGNIILQTNGRLRLRVGTTVVGTDSAPLTVGQLYRIGIHQRRGTGGNAVLEVFLATGDNAFGSPFATTTTGTWTTAADRVRIGATGADPVDATIDDIRLDAAAMPGPSQ